MVRETVKFFAIALIFAAGTFACSGALAQTNTDASTTTAGAKSADPVGKYTQAIIDSMDTDKNGEVSRAEFMDFMGKEFDRLDVNHDGKLQKSEILNKDILPNRKTKVR